VSMLGKSLYICAVVEILNYNILSAYIIYHSHMNEVRPNSVNKTVIHEKNQKKNHHTSLQPYHLLIIRFVKYNIPGV